MDAAEVPFRAAGAAVNGAAAQARGPVWGGPSSPRPTKSACLECAIPFRKTGLIGSNLLKRRLWTPDLEVRHGDIPST
jgi:hypothetical protein